MHFLRDFYALCKGLNLKMQARKDRKGHAKSAGEYKKTFAISLRCISFAALRELHLNFT
jgi:hypothetical protein